MSEGKRGEKLRKEGEGREGEREGGREGGRERRGGGSEGKRGERGTARAQSPKCLYSIAKCIYTITPN